MAFLTVGGVPLKIAPESWTVEYVPIGDVDGFSASGRPIIARGNTVRRWRGTVPQFYQDSYGAGFNEWRHWIEGNGLSWNADSASTTYSTSGVQLTGTMTRSASGGVPGGRIIPGSGVLCYFPPYNKFRQRGGWRAVTVGALPGTKWTIMAARKFIAAETASAGWHHIAMSPQINKEVALGASGGAPSQVSQWVDGVPGAYTLANVMCATNTQFGWAGYTTGGAANGTIEYDEMKAMPFGMNNGWIAAYAAAFDPAAGTPLAGPALPRQMLGGDWVGAEFGTSGTQVEVIGRVLNVKQRVGRTNAVGFTALMTEFDVEFLEW